MPVTGAYVNYNYQAMLGVLAIEATRVGGMVIGEDLGTVPDYARQVLGEHGVLGTEVEWFARVDHSPNAGDPYMPSVRLPPPGIRLRHHVRSAANCRLSQLRACRVA